jgi:hypothetical protein
LPQRRLSQPAPNFLDLGYLQPDKLPVYALGIFLAWLPLELFSLIRMADGRVTAHRNSSWRARAYCAGENGLLIHALALPFRSRASLETEIVFLRHQLNC